MRSDRAYFHVINKTQGCPRASLSCAFVEQEITHNEATQQAEII